MKLKRKRSRGWEKAFRYSALVAFVLKLGKVEGLENLEKVETEEFWIGAKEEAEKTAFWERLKSKKTWENPLIVAPKHAHRLDMFVLGRLFGLDFPLRFLAKPILFKIPFVAHVVKLAGSIRVERGKNDGVAAKESVRALRNNEWLGIYPEGGTKGNSDYYEFDSTVKLAQRFCVPVLPVSMKVRGKIIKRLDISFGEPYFPVGEVTKEAKSLQGKINVLY